MNPKRRARVRESKATVFLSWSGTRSKQTALSIRALVMSVYNSGALVPWMSETDIEGGRKGVEEVDRALADSKFGILCLTPESLLSPWVVFEAGRLTGRFANDSESLVIPVLCDLGPQDMYYPLRQYQAIPIVLDDMRTVAEGLSTIVQTLNRRLGENIVPERDLTLRLKSALNEQMMKDHMGSMVAMANADTRADRLRYLRLLFPTLADVRLPNRLSTRTALEIYEQVEPYIQANHPGLQDSSILLGAVAARHSGRPEANHLLRKLADSNDVKVASAASYEFALQLSADGAEAKSILESRRPGRGQHELTIELMWTILSGLLYMESAQDDEARRCYERVRSDVVNPSGMGYSAIQMAIVACAFLDPRDKASEQCADEWFRAATDDASRKSRNSYPYTSLGAELDRTLAHVVLGHEEAGWPQSQEEYEEYDLVDPKEEQYGKRRKRDIRALRVIQELLPVSVVTSNKGHARAVARQSRILRNNAKAVAALSQWGSREFDGHASMSMEHIKFRLRLFETYVASNCGHLE